jgi:PKD repeat protein
MGKNWLYRMLPLTCLIVVALLLIGCGGTDARADALGGDGAANPAALPAPEGVDAGVWALLTDELDRVLAETGAGKRPSAVPSGAAGQVEIAYDPETATLSWLYQCSGDYDQNGIVGVTDLTPLGVHFGEVSPAGAGEPFPEDSLGSVIDGNSDGLIGISDVTPIGQNFGARVAGYHVYLSDDPEDYPLNPADGNGPGTLLSTLLDFSTALGDTGERKRFEYALPGDAEPGVYWVRPTDGGSDGWASNAVAVGTPNLAPIAVLGAEPTAGLAPLTVKFSATASGDLDGAIAKYEWDWNGLVGGEEWEDTGGLGVATHVYEEAGSYLATLRVTDDGGGTDTDLVLIKVRMPVPPVASLDGGPTSGFAPLAVVYDASTSSDADGEVVDYKWDFDGTGNYAYDSVAEAVTTFYYYEPGTYSASVRVTDDDGLSTDSAGVEVTVEPGAAWHDVTVPVALPRYLHLSEVAAPRSCYGSLGTCGQRPQELLPISDDSGSTFDSSIAVEAGRPSQRHWSNSDLRPWRTARSIVAGVPFPSFGGDVALRLSMACRLVGTITTARLDLAGGSWESMVRYATGSFTAADANPALCVVADRPAISYANGARLRAGRRRGRQDRAFNRYRRPGQRLATRPLVVGGHPAIAYLPDAGHLKYVRALDAKAPPGAVRCLRWFPMAVGLSA